MKDNWFNEEMIVHEIILDYHLDDKLVEKNKKIKAEN